MAVEDLKEKMRSALGFETEDSEDVLVLFEEEVATLGEEFLEALELSRAKLQASFDVTAKCTDAPGMITVPSVRTANGRSRCFWKRSLIKFKGLREE